MPDKLSSRDKLAIALTLILNAALGWSLLAVLQISSKTASQSAIQETNSPSPVVDSSLKIVEKTEPEPPSVAKEADTVFSAVYSHIPKRFAANLRAIHCPEETVKDIIAAELSRKYRGFEQALRPTPADHVPYTWSASTSENRLFERRQQAATLTRDKAADLREILGYDVPVPMPLYAANAADQRFDEALAGLSPDAQRGVSQARERYWAEVRVLQERTKGFWEPEDIAELNRYKEERRQSILPFLLGASKDTVDKILGIQ